MGQIIGVTFLSLNVPKNVLAAYYVPIHQKRTVIFPGPDASSA